MVYHYHKFGTTRHAIRAFKNHLQQGKLTNIVKVYGECSTEKWYRLHVVTAEGIKRTYTGFAWWYGGEGPHGLVSCLSLLGIDAAFLLSHAHKGNDYFPNGFLIQL
jgi:hypothetical protein